MSIDRRSVLSALGLVLPFGAARAWAAGSHGPPPVLRFRRFEDAVRDAFRDVADGLGGAFPCRRVEVGHSDLVRAGVQGCHNDRPFAGFPAGHLRVVRTGAEPGPEWGGVRLFVCTVDVVLTGGRDYGDPGRPLDFGALPPAPVLAAAEPEAVSQRPESRLRG